ncbi:MAG: hypothetical protein JXL81_14465 [Deltaproteobacteria bacterium]|nr:hypothetical protein [Deltaproteobacteria bacterium]
MKYKIVLTVFTGFFLCCFLFTAFAQDNQTKGYPIAFLLEPQYKFDSVIEGTDVVHDFIIQNKGTADLNIIKVDSG